MALNRAKNSEKARILTVTGGKGGVGKSSVALNLALARSRAGERVLLVDADLGLGNVDILLGLNPKYNLGHVVRNERRIDEVTIEGPYGLSVIPAASGVSAMANLSLADQANLLRTIAQLAPVYDLIVMDTAAGISPAVIQFALASEYILLVLVNEPAALTDAYGLVKVLSRDHGRHRFDVLVNRVSGELEAKNVYRRFCQATDKFLDVAIGFAGAIPLDYSLLKSVRLRKPLFEVDPHGKAAVAIARLGEALPYLSSSETASFQVMDSTLPFTEVLG